MQVPSPAHTIFNTRFWLHQQTHLSKWWGAVVAMDGLVRGGGVCGGETGRIFGQNYITVFLFHFHNTAWLGPEVLPEHVSPCRADFVWVLLGCCCCCVVIIAAALRQQHLATCRSSGSSSSAVFSVFPSTTGKGCKCQEAAAQPLHHHLHPSEQLPLAPTVYFYQRLQLKRSATVNSYTALLCACRRYLQLPAPDVPLFERALPRSSGRRVRRPQEPHAAARHAGRRRQRAA